MTSQPAEGPKWRKAKRTLGFYDFYCWRIMNGQRMVADLMAEDDADLILAALRAQERVDGLVAALEQIIDRECMPWPEYEMKWQLERHSSYWSKSSADIAQATLAIYKEGTSNATK